MVAAKDVFLVSQADWPRKEDALVRVTRVEALLAVRAEEAHQNIANLVFLESDDLRHPRPPIQVDELSQGGRGNGKVRTQRELKGVVFVPWEAKSIVEKKILVRAVAVAVEHLITWFESLAILVHEAEVRVLRVLFRVKPTELLLCLFTVDSAIVCGPLLKSFGLVGRHIFRSLVAIKPFILLQSPLGDRAQRLVGLPPLLLACQFGTILRG